MQKNEPIEINPNSKEYFRGFAEFSPDKFPFGFEGDSEKLIETLKKQGFSEEQIQKIVHESEKRNIYQPLLQSS